tara:strand:- start:6 stop:812 length:807 start_codon:yes stop_codon:yes gene_type:complete
MIGFGQAWEKTFGGIGNDEGYSVQQNTDGGYIVCGRTESFGNGWSDVWLIKTDVNGDTLWTNTFGGTSTDEGYSVQQTNDGGYIICGWTESSGNGNKDVYLVKTDDNGDSLWTKTFGGTGNDEGYSVQQTNDGGYIICGYTESFGNGGYDVWLIKTDGNGIEQWNQLFGGTGYDVGYSVQQTIDGGYIIAGRKEHSKESSKDPGYDLYLIKTDGDGNVTSTFNIPTPNTNRKLQKTVDILGKETKPKTNTPFIEIYDDGTVEKRIVIE